MIDLIFILLKFCVANVNEDFCGVESITYPPEEIELRPPIDLDEQKVLDAYHKTNVALVSCEFVFS